MRLVAEISNLDSVENDFSDFLDFQTAKFIIISDSITQHQPRSGGEGGITALRLS